MDVALSTLLLASLVCLGQALAQARSPRWLRSLADRPLPTSIGQTSRAGLFFSARGRQAARGMAVLLGALLGLQLAGPVGLVGGGAGGWLLPRARDRRRVRRRQELLETQLAEVVETSAMAVKSGLSIGQALEFAATEAEPPMRELLADLMAQRSVGAPLEEALDRFRSALATDEGTLFVLILSIHSKSGGDLAPSLAEVADTIHHRMAVRRELRALTAQGRISGTILGGLPIGFFLVLSATSRGELAPIYRSPAGIAMLAAGLLLEGVAYVWIRRLMRVRI